MSVVRVLRWIGVSVPVVALALILHLSFGDLGWIRPRAEAAISKATGREFEIAGGLHWTFCRLPRWWPRRSP